MLLKHVIVHNILGEYTHEIKFNDDKNYAIVYGPNGVGKTKLLEIIKAASELSYDALTELPFGKATLTYDDTTELNITRTSVYNEEEDENNYYCTITLALPDGSKATWQAVDENDEFYIKRNSVTRLYGKLLEHLTDQDEVHELSPDSIKQWVYLSCDRELGSAPAAIKAFKDRSDCHLIETQRLKIQRSQDRFPDHRPRKLRDLREEDDRITVLSKQIIQLLNEAQTQHSQLSRQKERSFPNRVLSAAQNHKTRDANRIRELYKSQNEFRDRLAKVVSDSVSEGLELPDGNLDDWALALLDLYVQDASEKLKPFEKILERIELLQTLVNKRLLNKTLSISENKGLTIRHNGKNEEIPLTSLSSGEQHQIILLCDLLLNVKEGALVLIDEPEISLHVAWQLDFIPDVIQIAKLVGFRFIVATHSPQIINGMWKEAIQLGPTEASFQ
jgi:hypothetical protein